MSTIRGSGGASPRWEDPDDAAAAAASAAPGAAEPQPIVRSRDVAAKLPFGAKAKVREFAPKPLAEPSGIAFHAERGTLYVVGDRGHVVELGKDGRIKNKVRVGDFGFEGVTVGPGGRVYAAVEEKPLRILELDPDTLKIKKSFKIDPDFGGKRVIARHDNDGIEGLCYVPEDDAFYALNQDRPPRIVKLDLSRKKEKAEIVEVIDLKGVVKWGSDLTYDPKTRHFLVTQAGKEGEKGVVHELTRNGRQVRSVALPGDRQEGLALGPGGEAYIAQDTGGVLKVTER